MASTHPQPEHAPAASAFHVTRVLLAAGLPMAASATSSRNPTGAGLTVRRASRDAAGDPAAIVVAAGPRRDAGRDACLRDAASALRDAASALRAAGYAVTAHAIGGAPALRITGYQHAR